MAMITRMITGTMVHITSRTVLCAVLLGVGLARRLYRTMIQRISASTKRETAVMM